MKGQLQSKTLWVARLLMLIGLVQQNWELLGPYFGEYGGLALFLVGVVQEVLRWKTKEPVTLKKKVE